MTNNGVMPSAWRQWHDQELQRSHMTGRSAWCHACTLQGSSHVLHSKPRIRGSALGVSSHSRTERSWKFRRAYPPLTPHAPAQYNSLCCVGSFVLSAQHLYFPQPEHMGCHAQHKSHANSATHTSPPAHIHWQAQCDSTPFSQTVK